MLFRCLIYILLSKKDDEFLQRVVKFKILLTIGINYIIKHYGIKFIFNLREELDMDNLIKLDSKNKEFLEKNEGIILKYIDKKGENYLNSFKDLKNKINLCAFFLDPFIDGL